MLYMGYYAVPERSGEPCHMKKRWRRFAESGKPEAAQGAAHSAYTVEFTYEGRQYMMPGDSTVRLSEILDAVGLTGEVTAVAVSDTTVVVTASWI